MGQAHAQSSRLMRLIAPPLPSTSEALQNTSAFLNSRSIEDDAVETSVPPPPLMSGADFFLLSRVTPREEGRSSRLVLLLHLGQAIPPPMTSERYFPPPPLTLRFKREAMTRR